MLETLLQKGDTEERCGVILKDGKIVEIPNVAKDKENSYLMDNDQVLPFIKNDKVAATWHTHPQSDPNLSGEDYNGFLGWPDLEHYIIGRRKNKTVVMKFKVEDGLIIVCD